MPKQDYQQKFDRIQGQTLFSNLSEKDQVSLRQLASDYQFSQQQLRQFAERCIDFGMWGQDSPIRQWQVWRNSSELPNREFKSYAFKRLQQVVDKLSSSATRYDTRPVLSDAYKKTKIEVRHERADEKIFGMCPVQSEKTLCCNLRTIDAVKNCGFGCSYCSIQTMFTGDEVQFDDGFADKLEKIELEADRYYHIGTGQSSDALMWGNKNGILDSMLGFARKWPKALIEFKTKSKNIRYFLKQDVPRNIVCSWSLNPDDVIQNEEHLCASLEQRLQAARQVADAGIKVAFHLHPMVYFDDWQNQYAAMINQVQSMFRADEVLFISFGTLTFPKPIMKKIRGYGIQSQILRMPMVANPEGKLTYPDDISNLPGGLQALFQRSTEMLFILNHIVRI